MPTTSETLNWLDTKETQFNAGRESINWETIAVLEKELEELTPQKDYGFISGGERLRSFTDTLQEQLENGTANEFLQKSTADLANVYVVHAKRDSLTSDKQRAKWDNHRQKKLRKIAISARSMLENLQTLDLPAPILQEYEAKLRGIESAASMLIHTGKPEFTKRMYEHGLYQNIYEVTEEDGRNQLKLRYAEQAKNELELVANSEPLQWFANLGELLQKFRFTEEELQAVGLDNLDHELQEVGYSIASKLAQAWLNRSEKFNTWEIVPVETSTMSVNAKGREIKVPENESLTIDRLALLLGHEGFHALRGRNGEEQGMRFAKTGAEDYLADEEGGASLMELLLGQPRGHERQLILAGRTHAIHMALQTVENENGELVAKYSIQEIYDELVNYDLDTINPKRNVAAWIVDRIFRGTSYQQQIVKAEIPGEGTIQVPEVVLKDAIYYTGILDLFANLASWLPTIQEQPELVQDVLDGKKPLGTFTELLGKQIAGDTINLDRQRDSQEYRKYLENLGEEALLSLVQLMSVGKLRAEMIFTSEEWPKYLQVSKDEGIIQIAEMMYGVQ